MSAIERSWTGYAGAALAWLVVLGWTAAAFAQGATIVSFSPQRVDLNPGETATVDVIVEGGSSSGVAAIQIDLDFDPAVVQIRDPNEEGDPDSEPYEPVGSWLLTDENDRVAYGPEPIEDNAFGRVQFAYGTAGNDPPPSPPGVIGRILVEAQGNGAVIVNFVLPIVANDNEPPEPHPTVVDPLVVVVGGGFPNSDADRFPDALDNCDHRVNPSQSDANGDGIGDVCQCADMNGDGLINGADLTLYKRFFGGLSSPFSTDRCGVSPAPDGGACNGADLTIIKRYFGGLSPGITNTCAAYVGP